MKKLIQSKFFAFLIGILTGIGGAIIYFHDVTSRFGVELLVEKVKEFNPDKHPKDDIDILYNYNPGEDGDWWYFVTKGSPSAFCYRGMVFILVDGDESKTLEKYRIHAIDGVGPQKSAAYRRVFPPSDK